MIKLDVSFKDVLVMEINNSSSKVWKFNPKSQTPNHSLELVSAINFSPRRSLNDLSDSFVINCWSYNMVLLTEIMWRYSSDGTNNGAVPIYCFLSVYANLFLNKSTYSKSVPLEATTCRSLLLHMKNSVRGKQDFYKINHLNLGEVANKSVIRLVQKSRNCHSLPESVNTSTMPSPWHVLQILRKWSDN